MVFKENLRLKQAVDSLSSAEESRGRYAVCVLEASVPHKYDVEKFYDWRKELYVSEIHELSVISDDVEFRLLDQLESEYRRKATRFIASTPVKIHNRQFFTFRAYKEANLKRSEILNALRR